MKKSNALTLISNLALAATLTGLLGCASGNYQKGGETATGLKESADRIEGGKGKLDAVLASLNDMVANPQSDLVPKFKTFNTALSDLESTAQHVKDKVAAMREKGNEYFKAWDQQLATIQNEDIKTRSAERKAAVEKSFSDIKRSYAEAQIAFRPLITDLKDIQTSLKTDLTAGGIAAIKAPVEKANKDAVPLRAAIDKLATQFKDLGAAMAAAPVPPPK
jgi:hypothetical protein